MVGLELREMHRVSPTAKDAATEAVGLDSQPMALGVLPDDVALVGAGLDSFGRVGLERDHVDIW